MTPLHSTTIPASSPRRGLTFAEVVVSTLLVGLVLVSSMKTIGGVIRTWRATAEYHDGFTLAADLMTEVMQASYRDPDDDPGDDDLQLEDGESSGSRAAWDDTDDYDGWSASPPQAKDGTALTAYNGWTRSVDVQKVEVGDPNSVRSDNSSDKGLRRITVTVTDPGGRQTSLVAVRNAEGVMEQAPDTDTTFVLWVGSQLEVGSGAGAVRAGTNVTNHAEDE